MTGDGCAERGARDLDFALRKPEGDAAWISAGIGKRSVDKDGARRVFRPLFRAARTARTQCPVAQWQSR